MIDATRDLSRAQALCRALRGSGDHQAILVVMPEAGLAGLQRDWGASDFVLPGAGPAEVEARVRLLTQRPVVADPDAAIRVGDLVVDPVSYQVRLRGRPLDLTFKEFELRGSWPPAPAGSRPGPSSSRRSGATTSSAAPAPWTSTSAASGPSSAPSTSR